MQIFRSLVHRIKNDQKLFRYLANTLYKFFNVIERNYQIIRIGDKSAKVYRIIDIYDNGSLDVVCDQDPSPLRERVYFISNFSLHSKFFRGAEHLRSATYDRSFKGRKS